MIIPAQIPPRIKSHQFGKNQAKTNEAKYEKTKKHITAVYKRLLFKILFKKRYFTENLSDNHRKIIPVISEVTTIIQICLEVKCDHLHSYIYSSTPAPYQHST